MGWVLIVLRAAGGVRCVLCVLEGTYLDDPAVTTRRGQYLAPPSFLAPTETPPAEGFIPAPGVGRVDTRLACGTGKRESRTGCAECDQWLMRRVVLGALRGLKRGQGNRVAELPVVERRRETGIYPEIRVGRNRGNLQTKRIRREFNVPHAPTGIHQQPTLDPPFPGHLGRRVRGGGRSCAARGEGDFFPDPYGTVV